MSSPELVLPNRVEELLAGAVPDTDHEARLQGLARELRATPPSASAALRARVEGRSTVPGKRRFGRRTRLVLVVAAVGAFIAVATTGGLVSNGEVSGQGAEGGGASLGLVQQDAGQASDAPSFERAQLIPAGRAQDVDMWITLRVKDADQVSHSSQEAMGIIRELGGVVVSSNISTGGTRGQAQLTLKIPTARVEDASFRLSQLGTVTGQRLVTADLQAPIDRTLQEIERLRSAVRIAKARLASGLLDAEETLQMRIRLEHLRTRLRDVTRTHTALAQRAAMADLTLTLGTGGAAAPNKSEGGVAGASGTAFDTLKGAGAVAVFLAIVLSPIVLLIVLAWLALRARGRRIERQLLEEPKPATPRPRAG
jgi:Domain of unknown function (DUF4349)